MKVQYDDMVNEFTRVLIKYGFSAEKAKLSAKLFADNSLDGVYSHGVNRFPRVISYIEKGYIKPDQTAVKRESFGCVERWDGNLGMGNLNAQICMDRAIELAGTYGIGCVAIRNTNHWMRGGAYGWQAADAGCIGICWTNTMPNMPAWGAKDRRIGNNPFVIAIPRSDGRHVVADCAMAQFSYGKIEEYKLNGRKLPIPGGYDENDEITNDPEAIEKTSRVLPMGYWKGSGLSIALDLIATVLSGGNSVSEIGKLSGEDDYAVSQVMLAIDPRHFNDVTITDELINNVLEDIKGSVPVKENGVIYYPGENSYKTRIENMEQGIPVQEDIWKKIQSM